MAFRKLGVGGLELGVSANASGVGISLGYEATWLQRMVARVLRRTPAGSQPSQPAVDPMHDASAATPARSLKQRVDAQVWYHTIDLGNGILTRGQFDHRPLLPLYRLPESFSGQRVLDVATFDGFWAFEFERRGAAEVVALDLDKPSELDFPPKIRMNATPEQLEVKFGDGFRLAKQALGSNVERVACSVYDLTPELRGMFDVVHAGDFLIHLNSPVKALQRIASVTRGYALISDVYVPGLDRAGAGALMEYRGGQHDVTWWRYGLKALRQMILDAGFKDVEQLATFRYGSRDAPKGMQHVVFKAIK